MNIAVSINNLKTGGAETLVCALIRQWHQRGHKIFLLMGSESGLKIAQNLPLDEIKIIGNGIGAICTAAHFFRQKQIDLCISHLEKANKISALAGKLSGTPVWCTVHNIHIYTPGSLRERIARWIYNNCAKGMIAISQSVSEYMQEMGIAQEKIRLINNGIDIDYYQTQYHYAPAQTLSLLFVGRVEAVKGLDHLFRALAKLDTQEIKWDLTIVGDGAERDTLMQLAQELRIASRIIWHGSSPSPWNHLQNCRCLCLTSLREGLPMTLLEGMSIGVPMLVSRVGYLPELVDESCGILCTPGAEDEILQGLIRFAKAAPDDLLQMSIAAQTKVQQYSIQSCAEKYLELQ